MGSFGSGLGLGFAIWVQAGIGFAACAPDGLDLRGPGGQQHFTVEVADEAAERSQGLMFREKMATSAGMLFVYEQPVHAKFWMKNTLIPLDMIFVDAAGRVTRVHPNAVPHDETPIDGGEGVSFVLEINGGLAQRMGIVEGAEMRHPAIAQTGAVWPCNGE
ncbi:MAG: hypothetical protein A3D16_09805 [Rhodobacterales bacterium RIFCSPHIGHO2_02_FULL_62_130]|jgi:hypothetical protein|nr:MAG: hypothetical protein A3D16_09805 [Rhodobacterales bacterium RIFCSPHIGHO2_02_FULL_62_130]OHC56307.1 MAG: hypothetical protein A3E48_20730 [Rhodobacterales bacterium RIFCSPHIGHO2_12_FULL_62_75]